MNEDTVSDADENTEASNAGDVEQPQVELPSDDINLGPESFPSSTDSTENYLQSNKLPKIKQKLDTFPKIIALIGRQQLLSQEQERVLVNMRTF